MLSVRGWLLGPNEILISELLKGRVNEVCKKKGLSPNTVISSMNFNQNK